MPQLGAIPVPPPGAAGFVGAYGGARLPVVAGPGNAGYAVNNHPGSGDVEEKMDVDDASSSGANATNVTSDEESPSRSNVSSSSSSAEPALSSGASGAEVTNSRTPRLAEAQSTTVQRVPMPSNGTTGDASDPVLQAPGASAVKGNSSGGGAGGKESEDKDSIEFNPLTSENAAIQEAHDASDNHTVHKIKEEKVERDALAENQAHHDDMINQLKSIHSQMLIAMHDPTNAHDVEQALNATVEGMTGLEAVNDVDKDTDVKISNMHVNVNVMRHKSEQEHKREQMAIVVKKEKLYAMSSEWKARCAKWTARLDKARMVLANAFKGAMKASKLAQKGCLANQNDHITKAQLKWSSLAINEVKCTFKYLLTVKVNKMKICDASRKASLSAKTLQRFPMPALDGVKGLHSDKLLALLGLNNKRASEKTSIARQDAKALRADYEAKGMGEEKKVQKEIDTDDGTPKDGVETLDMVFERIMGRGMNLTFTKPQHYSNNRTLPNPLEMAKEECLGGNCNITSVDEKNDKHVKLLQKRKVVDTQIPPPAMDMPVLETKRL
eukprot:g5858.t1